MTYRTNCRTFDFVFLLLGNQLVINQYKRPFLKKPLESPVLAHLRFPRFFFKKKYEETGTSEMHPL